MTDEKTFDELTQDYEELLVSLETKNKAPSWFNVIFKNIINKTVSLEEWNTFMNYVHNNSSDISAITKFTEAVYDYLKTLGPMSVLSQIRVDEPNETLVIGYEES